MLLVRQHPYSNWRRLLFQSQVRFFHSLATFLSASFLKLGSTMLGVNVGKSNGTFLTNDNSKINFSSVIGSSTTQIFLCSAVSPWDHVNEAFLCPILRFVENVTLYSTSTDK